MDFKFLPLEERIAPSRAAFHKFMAEMRHLLAEAQNSAASVLNEHGIEVVNDGQGHQSVVVNDANQQQVVSVQSSASGSIVVTNGGGAANVQVVNDGHGQQAVVVTSGNVVVQSNGAGGQQVLVNTAGASGAPIWAFQI